MSFFSVVGGILGGIAGTVVAPGVGTVIGAALGSSMGGSADSSIAQSEANDTNVQLSHEAQQLSREENALNRKFNAEQATLAFERQRQLQQEQNEWNSASSQMARMRAAGVNPFVAAQGLSQATGSVGQTAQASAPPGQSFGSAQVNPVTPVGVSIVDGVLKYANAYQALSQAGLNDANRDKIIKLLPGELISQDLANTFDAIYKPQLANAQQQQILQDVALKVQQALTLAKEGKLADANRIKAATEATLNRMLAGKAGEEAKFWKQKNETFMTEFDANMRLVSSQVNSNNASAEASRALADLSKENKEKIEQEVISATRLNGVLDKFNSTDFSTIDGRELTVFERSVFGALHESYKKGLLTSEQFALLNAQVPWLIQQAKNSAQTSTPWTGTYFMHQLLSGAAAAGTGAAAIKAAGL